MNAFIARARVLAVSVPSEPQALRQRAPRPAFDHAPAAKATPHRSIYTSKNAAASPQHGGLKQAEGGPLP